MPNTKQFRIAIPPPFIYSNISPYRTSPSEGHDELDRQLHEKTPGIIDTDYEDDLRSSKPHHGSRRKSFYAPRMPFDSPPLTSPESSSPFSLLSSFPYSAGSVSSNESSLDSSSYSSSSSSDIATSILPSKGLRFCPQVIVGYTWSSNDYDRTSIEVDPLTKQDVVDILELRQHMHMETASITRRAHDIAREKVECATLRTSSCAHERSVVESSCVPKKTSLVPSPSH